MSSSSDERTCNGDRWNNNEALPKGILEVRVRGFSDALDALDNDDWQQVV